jgi:hypothetical protein
VRNSVREVYKLSLLMHYRMAVLLTFKWSWNQEFREVKRLRRESTGATCDFVLWRHYCFLRRLQVKSVCRISGPDVWNSLSKSAPPVRSDSKTFVKKCHLTSQQPRNSTSKLKRSRESRYFHKSLTVYCQRIRLASHCRSLSQIRLKQP